VLRPQPLRFAVTCITSLFPASPGGSPSGCLSTNHSAPVLGISRFSASEGQLLMAPAKLGVGGNADVSGVKPCNEAEALWVQNQPRNVWPPAAGTESCIVTGNGSTKRRQRLLRYSIRSQVP
jgi:hypothetical protein